MDLKQKGDENEATLTMAMAMSGFTWSRNHGYKYGWIGLTEEIGVEWERGKRKEKLNWKGEKQMNKKWVFKFSIWSIHF